MMPEDNVNVRDVMYSKKNAMLKLHTPRMRYKTYDSSFLRHYHVKDDNCLFCHMYDNEY